MFNRNFIMNGDNPALTWKIDLRDLPRMMVQGKENTMLLSDPPCSRLASTCPEEPRKMKKQPNAGRVDQL